MSRGPGVQVSPGRRGSLCRERQRRRFLGRLYHVDECAKGGRHLTAARMVEIKARKNRGPILQDPDQLPRTHKRFGLAFDGVSDAYPIGRCAQGKLAGVDDGTAATGTVVVV